MSSNFNQKLITDRTEKSVEKYLDDIRDTKPLTREEEVELSRRIKEGDEKALHKLIEANLKYVVTEAKKYQSGLIPLSELIAQGNIGAIEAAKRYDGEMGNKFITYLKQWTHQSIMQYLTDYGRQLRLPANQYALLGKIRKFKESYYQSNGEYPGTDIIAKELDVDFDKVYFLGNKLRSVVSIDSTLSNDGDSTVGSTIEDTYSESPADGLMNESLRIGMDRVIEQLSPRDKGIVRKLFGIGYNREFSLDEVAEDYDITRERVRQLKEKSLKKMKVLINRNNVI